MSVGANDGPTVRPIPPLGPEEFLLVLSLGTAAALAAPMPVAAGEVPRFVFTDSKESRFALAVKQHCAGDDEKCFAMMMRWFAWVSLRHDAADEFRRWVTPDGDRERAHRAIVEAVASWPLTTERHQFVADEFFAQLEVLAASDRYRDEPPLVIGG
jgi:hypothetical protein